MNKAVLISIRPDWCEKIASGQKTIEVRKNRPKLKTPFKCYIYCTKPKIYNSNTSLYLDELYRLPSGEIKFGSSIELSRFPDQWNKDNFLNSKVIGVFTCDWIKDFGMAYDGKYSGIDAIHELSCLGYDDMYDYIGEEYGYGWHISDLVIYDKPKELKEFSKYWDYFIDNQTPRPPQSWCYVEELT